MTSLSNDNTIDETLLFSPRERSRDGDDQIAYDDVLRSIGGFSRFNYIACVVLMSALLTGDMFVTNLGYFQLLPHFECDQDGGFQACQQDQYCELDSSLRRVDWSHPKSLYNWTERLDLNCASKAEFGLLGSLVFFGWTVASVFVPRMSDLYGRKWLLVATLAIQHIVMTCLVVSKSYFQTAVLLFFLGMCAVGRWTITYIYLMEFMTEYHQKVVGPLTQSLAGLVFVFSTLMFDKLTKHIVYLEVGTVTVNFILLLICVCYMPESPKYLLSKGKGREAKKVLRKMARVNKCSTAEFQDKEITLPRTLSNGALSSLWNIKDIRNNLLILIMIWSVTSFGFYMMNFILKYLDGDIFVNTYVFGSAEFVAKMTASLILVKVGLKRLLLIAYSLTCAGVLLLALFFGSATSTNHLLLTPCLLVLTRFGLAQAFIGAYLGAITLIPTSHVSSAMGLCNIFARISTIAAPFVSEMKPPTNLYILLCLAILVAFLSQLLSVETKPSTSQQDDFARVKSTKIIA